MVGRGAFFRSGSTSASRIGLRSQSSERLDREAIEVQRGVLDLPEPQGLLLRLDHLVARVWCLPLATGLRLTLARTADVLTLAAPLLEYAV
jgi:hypothetical protein